MSRRHEKACLRLEIYGCKQANAGKSTTTATTTTTIIIIIIIIIIVIITIDRIAHARTRAETV